MRDDFLVEFGNRLKLARKEGGFKSRKKICELLGIHFSTYGLYETGKRPPNALLVKRIGNLLNINFHWLFTGENFTSGIDRDLFTAIFLEVDRYVRKKCLVLSCREKSEIIGIIYDNCIEKNLCNYRMTNYQKSMIKMVADPQETNKNE